MKHVQLVCDWFLKSLLGFIFYYFSLPLLFRWVVGLWVALSIAQRLLLVPYLGVIYSRGQCNVGNKTWISDMQRLLFSNELCPCLHASFLFFVFGTQPAVLRTYSSICIQWSFLAVFGGTIWVLAIEPLLVLCKANMLLAVLSLLPIIFMLSGKSMGSDWHKF